MLAFNGNRVRIADKDAVDLHGFIRRYREKSVDGIVIAASLGGGVMLKRLSRLMKINGVDKIAAYFTSVNAQATAFAWLDPEKFLIPYLEVNVTDGCNLNCKGCSHFSPLYSTDESYNLKIFDRDMRQLARHCDILTVRIVGGEPFLLKNLDEYLATIKKYFPQTSIRVLSNGLLIPAAPAKILEYMSREKIDVDISEYPPTQKIRDKLQTIFQSHGISYVFSPVEKFRTIIRREEGLSNPIAAQSICPCRFSRYIRDGRLYKCPIDALHPRFNQKFPNARQLPPDATSIDIFADNFIELIDMLDEPVEYCSYCPEKPSAFEWKIDANPVAENWIG